MCYRQTYTALVDASTILLYRAVCSIFETRRNMSAYGGFQSEGNTEHNGLSCQFLPT
jgi:hypothetical protein